MLDAAAVLWDAHRVRLRALAGSFHVGVRARLVSCFWRPSQPFTKICLGFCTVSSPKTFLLGIALSLKSASLELGCLADLTAGFGATLMRGNSL